MTLSHTRLYPTPADVVMHPVQSSAIKAIGYHASTNTLFIDWLSGHRSAHDEVPEQKFRAMLSAPSIGKHFHAHIKNAHPGRAC